MSRAQESLKRHLIVSAQTQPTPSAHPQFLCLSPPAPTSHSGCGRASLQGPQAVRPRVGPHTASETLLPRRRHQPSARSWETRLGPRERNQCLGPRNSVPGAREGAPSCLVLAKESFILNKTFCRTSVHETEEILITGFEARPRNPRVLGNPV